MLVSEWRAWSRLVYVFFALDPGPPASDTPVLLRLVLVEVLSVFWPWCPPISRTEFKYVVSGSAFAGRVFCREGGEAFSSWYRGTRGYREAADRPKKCVAGEIGAVRSGRRGLM